MKNERKNVASVEVEGKKYELAYDFRAICETEKEAGCNLLNALMDFANLSAAQLRGLLVAAIRGADPKSKMTIAQMSELLKPGTILLFSGALAQALLLALPKPKEAPAELSVVAS